MSPSPAASKPRQGGAAAAVVAAGILASKLAGLVRIRVVAHYLGNSDANGALTAAMRIPNLLQNLFGEGVLSSSFIPVYAKLRAEGREAEANAAAGTVLGLLTAAMVVLVGAGILVTRPLIELLVAGFDDSLRDLTATLVQIMFPGVGLLVLSAWSLGVLNSHRQFFLPYAAPVVWNAAIIAAFFLAGANIFGHGASERDIVIMGAWGLVAGGALQLAVQLPAARRLNNGLHLNLDVSSAPVRQIIRNFIPVLIARGSVQISAYIDNNLASFLSPEAVSAIGYAQTISILPVSLFGMALSASELPEMSSTLGTADEVAAKLRARLTGALRRLPFFIVPSIVAFAALGDVLASTLLQTGHFDAKAATFVWTVLIGSAVGLLASTQGRLCVSAFYALHDTKTPTRYAFLRVSLSAAFGYLVVFPLRRMLDLDPEVASQVSAAALVGSAGVAGWIEFLLIKRSLEKRIGAIALRSPALWRCWAVAIFAGAVARGVKMLLPPLPPVVSGGLVLGAFAALYLGASLALGADEAKHFVSKLRRRRSGG